MFIRTTLSALAIALVGLLLVVLAPTGAAAHGGHMHAHSASSKTADSGPLLNARNELHASNGLRKVAVATEVRSQAPESADHRTNTDCGDRGCCSNGHCSGCGNALAPAVWSGFGPHASLRLLTPDGLPPSALAREGPPRPPKFFV